MVIPQKVSFKFGAKRFQLAATMYLQMSDQHLIASMRQGIIARLKFIPAADKITFMLSPIIPLR